MGSGTWFICPFSIPKTRNDIKPYPTQTQQTNLLGTLKCTKGTRRCKSGWIVPRTRTSSVLSWPHTDDVMRGSTPVQHLRMASSAMTTYKSIAGYLSQSQSTAFQNASSSHVHVYFGRAVRVRVYVFLECAAPIPPSSSYQSSPSPPPKNPTCP